MRSPPIVVAPSAMASSIADCVLALERLISSSNTKLAWIGPIWVENRWVEKSNTWVPTRSDGMRSGVHCTRRNVPETEVASVWAAVVLARPGTDSMRMCPPATIVAISASRKSDCPTSVWANLARMRSVSCRARRRSSCVSAAEGAGTGVRMGAAGMAPVMGIAFASWDGIEGFEVNKAMLPTLP